MAARNKLTAQERHIWSLRITIAGLALLLAIAMLINRTQIEDITLHIPPDLSQGVTMSAGQVPKANVFAFALYALTALNEWPDNGAEDYPRIIEEYACLLAPSFLAELKQSVIEKQRQGELSRARSVRMVSPYTESHVNYLGNGAWVAWLDLAISENVGGAPIKDTIVRYPVRVVRDERQCNLMQLSLDGYHHQPARLD